MSEGKTMTQNEKDTILHSMVHGLHALINGTERLQDVNLSHESLGDHGTIHEYVHSMERLTPDSRKDTSHGLY
jgi:hypothetical protein